MIGRRKSRVSLSLSAGRRRGEIRLAGAGVLGLLVVVAIMLVLYFGNFSGLEEKHAAQERSGVEDARRTIGQAIPGLESSPSPTTAPADANDQP